MLAFRSFLIPRSGWRGIALAGVLGLVALTGAVAQPTDSPASPSAPAAAAVPGGSANPQATPVLTPSTQPEATSPPSSTLPSTSTPATDAAHPSESGTGEPRAQPTAPAQPAASQPAPTQPAPAALPVVHDMSPWAMFQNADIVVKAVMVGLAFASVVTWTIWLAKRLQLAGARFRAVRAVRSLLKASSLGELERSQGTGSLKGGPVAALVHAAAHERERSFDLPSEGIKERAAIALQRVEARAARRMTKGTGLVATIGSTAPFVGLFGTVWGIMNSFVGISQAHTTNLAVVAPGIAEALLATAIGLVAAIPAVVIYNGLARAVAGYKALLSDASAEIMRHLSRDLDRGLQAGE